MRDPYTSACDAEIRAARDSGPRAPGDIPLVVLHSTEGAGGGRGEAAVGLVARAGCGSVPRGSRQIALGTHGS